MGVRIRILLLFVVVKIDWQDHLYQSVSTSDYYHNRCKILFQNNVDGDGIINV